MKSQLTALMSGMVLAATALSFSAVAGRKSLSPTAAPAAICRNIPSRRKRWRMLRGPITLSKIW